MKTKYVSGFVALCVLLAPALPARADSFRAAHASDGFSNFSEAAINNDGVVMFAAWRRDSAGKVFAGVYKSRGVGIRTVAESPAFDATPPGQMRNIGAVSINNQGLMALRAIIPGQGFNSVFVGGGAIGPAQEVNGIFSSGLATTITDNGYLGYGNIVQAFPENSTLGACETCAFPSQLNNRLEVLLFLGNDIHRVTIGPVKKANRTNPQLQPIRTNHVATVSEELGAQRSSAVLNDDGTVAFYNLPSAGVAGIYKSPATPVVETRSGSEFNFNNSPRFALNNPGQVVFLAASRTLGKTGFFRGPNPLTDKIVVAGDFVAGTQLDARDKLITLRGRWFNDRGQIVFAANAANDGGGGLWVTDGVSSPPPTDATAAIQWVGPSNLPPGSPPSGAFGTAGNWLPPNSEPPRVPEKTISRRDIAVFDRPGVYSVTIGDRYNQGVVIKNGDVSFLDGTYKTDALSFEEPSFVIDIARLTLDAGMSLTNNHALIGLSAASRVDVSGGWVTHGSLRVGGPGEGILNINLGGAVKSAEARIGTGVGGGKAIVAGFLATWETGNIAIGAGGRGELTITDSGHVSSQNAVIGQQSGLGNKVRVHGATAEGPSTWDLRDTLEVGSKGSGRLEILDGAMVDAAELRIGTLPYATGEVIVAGVADDNTPSFLNPISLKVGNGGVGELTITNGGRVTTFFGATIGATPSSFGRIAVSGRHPGSDLASSLKVFDDDFYLGDGTGILEIENGGLVEVSQSFYMFRSPSAGQQNEIRLVGNSRLSVGIELWIGMGSTPGKAVLNLLGKR